MSDEQVPPLYDPLDDLPVAESSGKVNEEMVRQVGLPRAGELNALPDAEFIARSRAFAADYLGLLQGETSTPQQQAMSDVIEEQMTPLWSSVEGLEGRALAAELITAFRRAYNSIFAERHKDLPFDTEQVDEETLDHVRNVAISPLGVPVLYTDGSNEQLFERKALQFACTNPLIERGYPPFVVMYDGLRGDERAQITAHERSHAVWALLERGGAIPAPEVGWTTREGEPSTFRVARDEAVSLLSAGQPSAAHANVFRYMQQEGYSNEEISTYRTACESFDRNTAEAAGMHPSDALLGVAVAQNFAEFNEHLLRMGRMAATRIAEHGSQTPQPVLAESEPSGPSGWTDV